MREISSRSGYFLAALAGGLVAALLMSAAPVLAGNGDGLVLGASNRAGRSTWLASRGPSVLKLNNTAGNVVLDLRNDGGAAPLAVDSDRKIDNLNADSVDGRHATDLIRAAFGANADAPDGDGDAASTTITAPRAGILVLSGSIDGSNLFGDDTYGCFLAIDGSSVSGTFRNATVTAASTRDVCSTTGAEVVSAGTYTVSLTIYEWDKAFLTNATVWVVYLPFDGSGSIPGA